MKKNIKFLFLLLVFFSLGAAKAQSHDNKGCALNKKFDPAKESYTCPVCIMQIEKAKAEKKQREANTAKEDNKAEKKAAAEKAAIEAERKKKEEAEKNKSPKDSTEKNKAAENPKIN